MLDFTSEFPQLDHGISDLHHKRLISQRNGNVVDLCGEVTSIVFTIHFKMLSRKLGTCVRRPAGNVAFESGIQ